MTPFSSEASRPWVFYLSGHREFGRLPKDLPYCAGLYGVNCLLFITAVLSHPQGRWAGLSGFPKVFGTSGFWSTAVLLTATSFAAHQIHSARYAEAETKASEKNLLNQEQGEKERVPTGETPPAVQRVNLIQSPLSNNDFRCGHCKMLAALKAALKTTPQRFGITSDITRWIAPVIPLERRWPLATHAWRPAPWSVPINRARASTTGCLRISRFSKSDTPEAAPSMLNAIAQDIGLDMNRFTACLDKPATKNTVQPIPIQPRNSTSGAPTRL